jgi:hypothetical protein
MKIESLYRKPDRGTILNRNNPMCRGLIVCLPLNEYGSRNVYDHAVGRLYPINSCYWTQFGLHSPNIFDYTQGIEGPSEAELGNVSIWTLLIGFIFDKVYPDEADAVYGSFYYWNYSRRFIYSHYWSKGEEYSNIDLNSYFEISSGNGDIPSNSFDGKNKKIIAATSYNRHSIERFRFILNSRNFKNNTNSQLLSASGNMFINTIDPGGMPGALGGCMQFMYIWNRELDVQELNIIGHDPGSIFRNYSLGKKTFFIQTGETSFGIDSFALKANLSLTDSIALSVGEEIERIYIILIPEIIHALELLAASAKLIIEAQEGGIGQDSVQSILYGKVVQDIANSLESILKVDKKEVGENGISSELADIISKLIVVADSSSVMEIISPFLKIMIVDLFAGNDEIILKGKMDVDDVINSTDNVLKKMRTSIADNGISEDIFSYLMNKVIEESGSMQDLIYGLLMKIISQDSALGSDILNFIKRMNVLDSFSGIDFVELVIKAVIYDIFTSSETPDFISLPIGPEDARIFIYDPGFSEDLIFTRSLLSESDNGVGSDEAILHMVVTSLLVADEIYSSDEIRNLIKFVIEDVAISSDELKQLFSRVSLIERGKFTDEYLINFIKEKVLGYIKMNITKYKSPKIEGAE